MPKARDRLIVELHADESYEQARKSFEVAYFRSLLQRHRTISAAARISGMDRNTFRRHAVAAGILLAILGCSNTVVTVVGSAGSPSSSARDEVLPGGSAGSPSSSARDEVLPDGSAGSPSSSARGDEAFVGGSAGGAIYPACLPNCGTCHRLDLAVSGDNCAVYQQCFIVHHCSPLDSCATEPPSGNGQLPGICSVKGLAPDACRCTGGT